MLRVDEFKPEDLRHFPDLSEQLRSEGITQVYGPAFAARTETDTLAIGGLVPIGGGTCEAWFHCRRDLGQYGLRLVWEVRGLLTILMHKYGFIRVQAKIDPTNAVALRFIKALRFTYEGTMESYWHGKDRWLFARIFR